MKRFVFYVWVALCAVCVFTACNDDDDSPKGLTTDRIVGTYTGTLQVLGTSIPNTTVSLTKVNDNTVSLKLKDFAFGGLTFGDISADCLITHDGDDLDLNGTTQLTVAALGNATLPVTITGDADGTKLDIDIQVSDIPAIGAIEVEYEGRK